MLIHIMIQRKKREEQRTEKQGREKRRMWYSAAAIFARLLKLGKLLVVWWITCV